MKNCINRWMAFLFAPALLQCFADKQCAESLPGLDYLVTSFMFGKNASDYCCSLAWSRRKMCGACSGTCMPNLEIRNLHPAKEWNHNCLVMFIAAVSRSPPKQVSWNNCKVQAAWPQSVVSHCTVFKIGIPVLNSIQQSEILFSTCNSAVQMGLFTSAWSVTIQWHTQKSIKVGPNLSLPFPLRFFPSRSFPWLVPPRYGKR